MNLISTLAVYVAVSPNRLYIIYIVVITEAILKLKQVYHLTGTILK